MGGTLFEGRDDPPFGPARRDAVPPASGPPASRRPSRAGSVLRSLLAIALTVGAVGLLAEWWSPGMLGSLRAPWAASHDATAFDGRADLSELVVGNGQSAQEYLRSHGAPDELVVAWSEDPELNCGLEKSEEGQAYIAGCYRGAEYPEVVFVYWDQFSRVGDRELLLLHEYAHYQQHRDEIEAVFLLAQREDGGSSVVEPDADCRAIELRGSTTDAFSCDIDGWSWDWLAETAHSS